MKKNINNKNFQCHSMKLAGFLMMRGFVLLGLREDYHSKRSIFLFKQTDELSEAVGIYKDKQQSTKKNKKDYFFCTNGKVSKHLSSKGIKYITLAKDMSGKKTFSLYEINDDLQKALEEYKNK